MNNIICSGALFYTIKTKRFLFLYRKNGKRNNQWGIVGGTNSPTETPWTGLQREISEEIGEIPHIIKTMPLETYISTDEQFRYHTYICIIEEEFIPNLNEEHDGYAWVGYDNWPKPLHLGLKNTLSSKINRIKLETIFNMVDLLKV
jgi:8-oxo-dGTP pyrophosphatase MutT (NUDIX family)